MARRRNFSRKSIRKYWARTQIWKNHFDSPEEFLIEKDACFACGFIYSLDKDCNLPLQRAHINALCIGGKDEISNIHLLCKTCHEASEYLSGKKYWKWFNTRNIIDVMLTTAAKYNFLQKHLIPILNNESLKGSEKLCSACANEIKD